MCALAFIDKIVSNYDCHMTVRDTSMDFKSTFVFNELIFFLFKPSYSACCINWARQLQLYWKMMDDCLTSSDKLNAYAGREHGNAI